MEIGNNSKWTENWNIKKKAIEFEVIGKMKWINNHNFDSFCVSNFNVISIFSLHISHTKCINIDLLPYIQLWLYLLVYT